MWRTFPPPTESDPLNEMAGGETAFSVRWNALKTKAENATKELAANIQEQRDRFVESRVKTQTEKGSAVQASAIDSEQHEEALRIVQYQNKALRYVCLSVCLSVRFLLMMNRDTACFA